MVVALGALLAFVLGCSGLFGEDRSAEIEMLNARLGETETALAAAAEEIARYEVCDCDCEEEEVAVALEPTPEPAAPAPVLEGEGQIEVKAATTVKILLDGKGMKYNFAKSAYIARHVDAGPHLLEVQNAMRKVTHSTTVDVLPGKRIRFQHRKGTLEALGTVDM
jgi:hypothetical protein